MFVQYAMKILFKYVIKDFCFLKIKVWSDDSATKYNFIWVCEV